jgi:hypothetical protein
MRAWWSGTLRSCRKTSAAVEAPSRQVVMVGECLPSTDFASSARQASDGPPASLCENSSSPISCRRYLSRLETAPRYYRSTGKYADEGHKYSTRNSGRRVFTQAAALTMTSRSRCVLGNDPVSSRQALSAYWLSDPSAILGVLSVAEFLVDRGAQLLKERQDKEPIIGRTGLLILVDNPSDRLSRPSLRRDHTLRRRLRSLGRVCP